MLEDQARASRIRDNKRRFRLRRKEYVADLERSLRQLRQQGVQATREVQLSARRVAKENVLLRSLLRSYGADEKVVNELIRRHHDTAESVPLCANICNKRVHQAASPKIGHSPDSISDRLPSLQLESPETEPNGLNPAGQCNKSTRCSRSSRATGTQCKRSPPIQTIAPQCSTSTSNCIKDHTPPAVPAVPQGLGPCRLMTRLAANPQTDLTQIPMSSGESTTANADEKPDDGIECSKAYQMLIQYATTEEKLETVALALERGCVKGPVGGCKVQNEAMWKALDELTG